MRHDGWRRTACPVEQRSPPGPARDAARRQAAADHPSASSSPWPLHRRCLAMTNQSAGAPRGAGHPGPPSASMALAGSRAAQEAASGCHRWDEGENRCPTAAMTQSSASWRGHEPPGRSRTGVVPSHSGLPPHVRRAALSEQGSSGPHTLPRHPARRAWSPRPERVDHHSGLGGGAARSRPARCLRCGVPVPYAHQHERFFDHA